MTRFKIPRDKDTEQERDTLSAFNNIKKGHVFEIDVPAEGTVLALKVAGAEGAVLFLTHADGFESFEMFHDSMARYPIIADHGMLVELVTKAEYGPDVTAEEVWGCMASHGKINPTDAVVKSRFILKAINARIEALERKVGGALYPVSDADGLLYLTGKRSGVVETLEAYGIRVPRPGEE